MKNRHPKISPSFLAVSMFICSTSSPFFVTHPLGSTRLLTDKWLLRKAAARSGMTSSKDLGEITISTFLGEDGPLGKKCKEFSIGFASKVRRSTVFVDGDVGWDRKKFSSGNWAFLCSPFFKEKIPFWILFFEYRNKAWKLLSHGVAQLDGCISPSRYFGDLMSDRLGLDRVEFVVTPMALPWPDSNQKGKLRHLPS